MWYQKQVRRYNSYSYSSIFFVQQTYIEIECNFLFGRFIVAVAKTTPQQHKGYCSKFVI